MKLLAHFGIILQGTAMGMAVALTQTQTQSTENLEIRETPRVTTCGTFVYDPDDINAAYTRGRDNKDQDVYVRAGNGNVYPEPFANKPENFKFDCDDGSGSLWAWPILQSHELFAGGMDQGPDRVVFVELAAGGYDYCGLMTHTGVPNNGFAQCH